MDYCVASVDQLNEAIDDGADFADYIRLQDGIDLTGVNVPRDLDFRIVKGGHVTVLVGEDDAHRPCERVTLSDIQVSGPPHYVWLGEALVTNGAPENTKDLQSWDLLDALFPDNPHLWNVGKYLTRFGRKGDASKRLEDLRKAATYLERAIKAEENHAS